MLKILEKNFTEIDFINRYDLLGGNHRILNAGSSSLRYGNNCINIDIQQKDNVDFICDIQSIPDSLGKFEVVICNAVLQYCQNPQVVANEFYNVLKPGGLLFIDAPWVQPFCLDTPDRFRFSEYALRSIFSIFEIIEVGPSIRPGSAFAMLGVHIAGSLTTNKYINYILRNTAKLFLFPLKGIRTTDESKTAGAFYMICRKPEFNNC